MTKSAGNTIVFEVGVIVVSDRAARGERHDGCLPVFEKHLSDHQYRIAETVVVSDDPSEIGAALHRMIDQKCSLVFTAGGTGCGVRDNTPEATAPVLAKRTPGIDEAVRAFSARKSPHAAFSRGLSGIAGDSLVINLPGSPKAVGEILSFLKPMLAHPLNLIRGEAVDCGSDDSDHD